MALLPFGAAFTLFLLILSSVGPVTSLPKASQVGVSKGQRDLGKILKEEQPGYLRTLSVIVVADVMHSSALFQDRARVEAYGGSGVVAVQFSSITKASGVPYIPRREPFEVGHPEGVDERIRIVYFNVRKGHTNPNENQISHLKASCEDHSETTIVMVSDETCMGWDFWSTACGSNYSYVFHHYPSSLPSPKEEPRYAYIPLGPRDTFPFIKRSRKIQRVASSRGVFFNLQVTPRTSPRREAVINITNTYALNHPEIQVHLSNSHNILPYQWQRLLQRSKFTICPGGHNPETFRLFEALETGSIPIVSRQDYLKPAHCAHYPSGNGSAAWNTVSASPFAQAVSVDFWEDLPELLDRLALMADDTINQLQVECERWYAALMQGTYASLLNFSSSKKFWPQDSPITPTSLHEAARP